MDVIFSTPEYRDPESAQQCFANPYDHKEAVLILVVEGGIGKEVVSLIRKGRKVGGLVPTPQKSLAGGTQWLHHLCCL